MPDKPIYRAIFQRDDNGSWFVRVPQVQGAHSHGRTLERATANIREATALALDVDEDSFEVDRQLDLPDEMNELLEYVHLSRGEAEEARMRALAATSMAADRLAQMGLSLRDAAELLGVSFQRVQQLRHHPVAPQDPTQILDLIQALTGSVEATRRRTATGPETPHRAAGMTRGQ